MIGSSWRRRFERLADLARVETQGKVSLGRVVAVARYAEQTSNLRRAAVILLTPLPSLIVTLLGELVPLAPPDSKHRDHWGYLTRLSYSTFVLTFLYLHQFAHCLPSLQVTPTQLSWQAICISVPTLACSFAIIYWVAFPIPFSNLSVAPMWMAFVIVIMALVWGKTVRNRFDELKDSITKTTKMMMCQYNLIGIYPVYYLVYERLSASERVVLMFLLPIIKIALRIWFSNSVTHLRDELPIVVVTNVDAFNALFMMYCMQITPSLMTTLGLMILDFAQSAFSLYDIRVILLKVNTLYNQVALPSGPIIISGSSSYVVRAAAIISRAYKPAISNGTVKERNSISISQSPGTVVRVQPRRLLQNPRVTRISPKMGVEDTDLLHLSPLAAVRALPDPSRIQSSLSPTTAFAETQFIGGVRQLVYVAEFLLLLNYVEFVIPVIYATYLAAVYHLPNMIYFPQIESMTADHLKSTLTNLYLYAGLELASLLLLHIVLSRVFHLPGLAQLAYTLETQWIGVQSKLVFWVFYNAQVSLKHNGKAFRLQLEVCVAPRAAYRFQSHRFVKVNHYDLRCVGCEDTARDCSRTK